MYTVHAVSLHREALNVEAMGERRALREAELITLAALWHYIMDEYKHVVESGCVWFFQRTASSGRIAAYSQNRTHNRVKIALMRAMVE